MNRFLLLPCLSLLCWNIGVAEVTKPNVVYILADDFGWGDLGINGGGIPTPRTDRLFEQGVRLDTFMGWCVCSPTRAMLMTGRHPFRVGTGPEVGGELAREETTMAEAFKTHGYRTGVFGKWHNGEEPNTPEYRAAFHAAFKDMPGKEPPDGIGVNEHGFDEAWVYYGGGPDHFTRRTVLGKGPVSWWHNRQYRPLDEGYTDDLVTQHALEFIRENKERPFFCYIPFQIVHSPMQAKPTELAGVDSKVKDETKRVYAAMVQTMDRNVGLLLDALDNLGLRENTIVVFSSDNGATKDGSNLPLRGGKHSVFEGGTRLPTVIHWPKGGLVGGKSWDGLCGALDMFPTLMSMAGLPMPVTRPLDGKNIWPAMRDGAASPVESYYWVWRDQDAIRTGSWRMHRYFDRVELYDIRADIGETRNIADQNPVVVKALAAKMDVWAGSLGAALSHQPVSSKLDAPPAPEGDVLEIRFTVTEKAKPKDRCVVAFANTTLRQFATDSIEFDLATSPDTPHRGNWYYSPFKGNEEKATLQFKKGEGIDQFGREQSAAPGPRGGAGTWEHRGVGLCGQAPGPLARQGFILRGGHPGTYTIYLDNLRVRHADGTTSPIWTNGKDTRARKMADTESFRDVSVRVVRDFPPPKP